MTQPFHGSAENNPERYAAMSKPFATIEECRSAMDAFFEDVRAAREKHRIRDVMLCVAAPVSTMEESLNCAHVGASDMAEKLAIFATSYWKAEREKLFALLVDAGKRASSQSVVEGHEPCPPTPRDPSALPPTDPDADVEPSLGDTVQP